MGTISDFVADFEREFNKYSDIEKRVEALCKDKLRNTESLWQSRVKNPASLEKKLRDRSNKYEDEAANIADVCDLVGGRIILVHPEDIRHVEKTVKETFNFVRQSQHPKDFQNIVGPETRFRGYNGLHLYVTLQGRSDEQCQNPVIEIQVMTAFMWIYATLQHDVVYKRLYGEPAKELLCNIDLLRGVANLGELGLEMYDKLFFQRDIYPDLQTGAQPVVGEGAIGKLKAQSQSVLQLTNPQHDKHRAESSTGQQFGDSALEKCAYALLRKQTGSKEAHLEGVTEARQTLLQGMTTPSQDDLPNIHHLRKLYHLAVAERKLSLKQGLDTRKMMEHLNQAKAYMDQAEAYIDKAVGSEMLSGLVGAREQITLERHIVRGLRAGLESRMHVRDWENTRRLLGDALAGVEQAWKGLEKVDVVKFEKNTKFALEWIRYFRKLHTRILIE